jgi:hypothetical protein
MVVNVELQQIVRRVARSPRRLRLDRANPAPERSINEGVDEPNRIVGLDVIVNRLRQQ